MLITIMFEFKNPSARVYLSQAKNDAFHLPYREGKFVYFICLVLNPIDLQKQQSYNDGLAKTIWHFEIGGGHEAVKSSPKERVLFLVVLFHSRWLKSLDTLYVIVVLTSKSFPIPFCTSRILCRDNGSWNTERCKSCY